MYRDNTLLPSEAVRVLALGLLAEAPRSYAGLASEIRHFSGRIVGPSLDLVGAPLEVLKIEGLVTARGDAAAAARHSDEALLEISADGRAELLRLLLKTVEEDESRTFSRLFAPLTELAVEDAHARLRYAPDERGWIHFEFAFTDRTYERELVAKLVLDGVRIAETPPTPELARLVE